MILSIFFIIIFVVCLLWVNHRNIITWSVSMYCVGLVLLLASSIMYISTVNLYKASNYLDYRLYHYFTSFKMNFSRTSRLINAGFGAVFVSSILIYTKFKKKKTAAVFAIFLPALLFMVINDPAVTQGVYYRTYSARYARLHGALLVYPEFIKLYCAACIVFFYALPVITLVRYSVNSRFYPKIKNTVVTVLMFVILDIYFIMLFVVGQFRIFMPYSVDLFKYPVRETTLSSTTLIQYILIFTLILLFFIFYYFKPFDNLTVITKKENRKNIQSLNKNVKMLFHTYKNLFFAIQGLSRQALDGYGTETPVTYDNLKCVNGIAGDAVVNITRILNMMTNVEAGYEYTDMRKCLDDALSKVFISPDITLVKNESETPLTVRASSSHLSDCFVNLIQNSVEAISLKQNKDGVIKIDIFDDDDLAVISIYDNGCGINKKNKKHIFDLMFSTKQTTNNCGIGLNYVKNAVSAFHGIIYVKSAEGEYTNFQIALPKAKAGRIQLN